MILLLVSWTTLILRCLTYQNTNCFKQLVTMFTLQVPRLDLGICSQPLKNICKDIHLCPLLDLNYTRVISSNFPPNFGGNNCNRLEVTIANVKHVLSKQRVCILHKTHLTPPMSHHCMVDKHNVSFPSLTRLLEMFVLRAYKLSHLSQGYAHSLSHQKAYKSSHNIKSL